MTQSVRAPQDKPTASKTPAGDCRRTQSRKSKLPLCIVGMGGSAGALEAVEQFFSQCHPDTGAAFVLMPHLDPTHEGIMPGLIQRCIAIKVLQVRDGTPVKANTVYVIPPQQGYEYCHC